MCAHVLECDQIAKVPAAEHFCFTPRGWKCECRLDPQVSKLSTSFHSQFPEFSTAFYCPPPSVALVWSEWEVSNPGLDANRPNRMALHTPIHPWGRGKSGSSNSHAEDGNRRVSAAASPWLTSMAADRPTIRYRTVGANQPSTTRSGLRMTAIFP